MQVQYVKWPVGRLVRGTFFALCMSCYSHVSAGSPTMAQSRASFEAAIGNDSTSPSYVSISIIDSETGQTRPVCTTANFLLGAIHREYGLGYGAADSSKAVQIALESKDHGFRFRPATLVNIQANYTDDQLSAARALLAPWSTQELQERFSLLQVSRFPNRLRPGCHRLRTDRARSFAENGGHIRSNICRPVMRQARRPQWNGSADGFAAVTAYDRPTAAGGITD